MSYRLYEHENAKKFFKKQEKDNKLLIRITKKYFEILENPHKKAFVELNSVKCPRCHRARVGNYRIIFYINEDKKIVEIANIIPRSDNYKFF